MAAPNLHYGAHAPTSCHPIEWPEPYFGSACCLHCPYRNLNDRSLEASGLQLDLSYVDVQDSDLEGLAIFSDTNFTQDPTFNVDLNNAQSYVNMGRSSDFMFLDQPSPPIRPHVESWFNLPDDIINPSFDATLANTSLPFDLPQDQNLTDEIFGTPSSTASEGLDFHVCDLCFKVVKSSNLRRHMNTHIKPHHCPIPGCSRAFSEKKDLRRHKATKHGIGAAIFYCKVAGCEWQLKGFSRPDTLKRHTRNVHHILVESEPTPQLYDDMLPLEENTLVGR